MGMVKIPKGTSWEKITWKRKKEKTKEKKNEMTISKDNKKVILLLLKLKSNKIVFIGDFEHSNPLLNSKTKVQKSKIWGISRWSLSPPYFLTSLYVSFLIPQNPLHVIFQPLLVPYSGIDVSRRDNVFHHPTTWPSLTNLAQDPIGNHLGVEGTFILRSSSMFSKLP